MIKITAEELVNELQDIGSLDDIVNEQHWDGGVNTSEFEKFALDYCSENKYELVDEENLSHEYYEAYHATEKGLS